MKKEKMKKKKKVRRQLMTRSERESRRSKKVRKKTRDHHSNHSWSTGLLVTDIHAQFHKFLPIHMPSHTLSIRKEPYYPETCRKRGNEHINEAGLRRRDEAPGPCRTI
jgi:hypothetical protein